MLTPMFQKLEIQNFSPFEDQTILFPEKDSKGQESDKFAETHILTGVNGTGKTRLLSLLAAILGNPEHLEERLKGAVKKAVFNANGARQFQSPNLSFSNGAGECVIEYNLREQLLNTPAFAYNGTAYIQDSKIALMAATKTPDRKINLSFSRPASQSQEVLQTTANLKIQAAMDNLNADPHKKHETSRPMRITNRLEEAISSITGREFKFYIESYNEPSITVNWGKDSRLRFSLLPDGLRSIIGWLAHAVVMMDASLQGKSDPVDTPAVFLLDEIESHLHPSWQRKILPAFQRLFPKAQVFVATHSPFVISSIEHGWIHCLKTNPETGLVRVEKAIPASQGNSYVSVLEGIMGLSEFYNPETETLLARFRERRDAAYRGDSNALEETRKLALDIAGRGHELNFMMGREMAQMDRQLTTT